MNKNTTDITLSAYFNDIVIGYYEDEALVKQLGRQLGFDVDMDTFMAVSFQYPSDMNVKPEDRERLTDAAQAVIGLSEINRRITGKQIITCDSGVCVILITHDKAEMRRILDACLQYGIFVMVDETYVEFAPEEKDVTSIPLTNYYTNLIILRGTSKFFAAPGLRLGYAVTGNQDLIKAINTRKNPWTINSLAEIAGRLMFPDEEYIRHTRELICRERDRLYNELSTWDSVTVYEASANFILMKIRKPGITSQDLFDHCIRKGLMIRDCSTFPFLDDHFVRFCVMLPEQNDRLLEAFKEVLL